MDRQQAIDSIIETSTFRRNVYNMIPEGASRVLDFGCGNGALLLRLQRDKACTELYGVEINAEESRLVSTVVERVWNINIEQDQMLPEECKGFFHHIVLHDVAEHLYDPWFTLAKIRSYLSPGGKLIVAVPNFHFWDLQYEMLSGRFPYGPGLWHTGHLRWYTPASIVELLLIAGLSIECINLEIPHVVDFSHLERMPRLQVVQFPLAEIQAWHPDRKIYTVQYPEDVKRYYPVFHAHKIIVQCRLGEQFVEPAPMTYHCGRLKAIRDAMGLPFDVYNPPPMKLLIGNWH